MQNSQGGAVIEIPESVTIRLDPCSSPVSDKFYVCVSISFGALDVIEKNVQTTDRRLEDPCRWVVCRSRIRYCCFEYDNSVFVNGRTILSWCRKSDVLRWRRWGNCNSIQVELNRVSKRTYAHTAIVERGRERGRGFHLTMSLYMHI